MARFPLLHRLTWLWLATGLVTLAPISQAQAEEPFVLLCHVDNPIASLSLTQLRRLFFGATKVWNGGTAVQVGIIPGVSPETLAFTSYLHMTPNELPARMQREIFRGELRRPVVLRSSIGCITLVKSDPGAICYSTPDAVTGHESEVKVLKIKNE